MSWKERKVAEEEIPAELALIPGGEFLVGADSEGHHSPVHPVRLNAFYTARCEVTNAQPGTVWVYRGDPFAGRDHLVECTLASGIES
jgi:formylglycine-generating enzyme required for sulfatase activity